MLQKSKVEGRIGSKPKTVKATPDQPETPRSKVQGPNYGLACASPVIGTKTTSIVFSSTTPRGVFVRISICW